MYVLSECIMFQRNSREIPKKLANQIKKLLHKKQDKTSTPVLIRGCTNITRNAKEDLGNQRVQRKAQEHLSFIDLIILKCAKILTEFKRNMYATTPTAKTPDAPLIQP